MSKKQKHDYYKEKIEWFEQHHYEEIQPLDYYRMIFSEGSFQKRRDSKCDFQPNGLLQFRCPDYKENSMACCIINDDLQATNDLRKRL